MPLEIRKERLWDVLYAHPAVGRGINRGLSGTTFIDSVIGVVEKELSRRPDDLLLQACYGTLQREYPLYFQSAGRQGKSPLRKNQAYKACNGF